MNFYVLLGVAIISLALTLTFIWLRRKKFTRERYAFFSTALIFTYALTVLTHIFADVSLFKIMVMLYNNLPVESIPISGTSWTDKAWSIAFLLILCLFVFIMFESWDIEGGISKVDKQITEMHESISFLRAAYLGMSISKIEVAELNNLDELPTKKMNFELCFLDEPRDWSSESRELLYMYTQHFLVKENEWHKDKGCFFGTYIDQSLLVICSLKMLSNEEILEKIIFFKGINPKQKLKVILSVRDSEGLEQHIQIEEYTVECYTKDFLLKNLINFSEYNNFLYEQFHEQEISEGDTVRLQDIYVESNGSLTGLNKSEDSLAIPSVEKYLLEWSASAKNEEQIALLGDYGQGKSVLSLKFANELISSSIERQPIIIELRGKSPRNMPMDELIAAWAYRFNYNVKAILKLLQEGKLVVILEGFDELDMVGDKLRRLEHFKKLWEFSRYKKSKVIITGRPNLFLNNDEARSYLKIGNGESTTFHVKALKLEPFNRKQIESALRFSPAAIRDGILEQYDTYKQGEGFADLIARPSTLFQTSILWDSLDKANLNSSKIINSFIDHAYKRQAQKLLSISGADLESPVLTAKEREYFMLGVAVGMVSEGGYSNQVSGIRLQRIVHRLFIFVPQCCSEDHHSGTLSLHERLQDDAIDSVYNDVRTSGILVRDLTSYDSFKFAHKSFLEALIASFFKNKIDPESNEKQIISNTIAKSLSISDIYNIEFSDEVISHVTENIVNQGQSFGDKEALSLMKVLSKKAIVLDKLFYKTRLKVNIWMLVVIFITIIFSYFSITTGFAEKLWNLNFEAGSLLGTLAALLFYSVIGFQVYSFGRALVYSQAKKLYPAVSIWSRACEVQGYDINNNRILSNEFLKSSRASYDLFSYLPAKLFYWFLRKKSKV
ncbi:hypothetical protein I6F65_13530 [Pseudoalteromonas sp. SWXJZ94C]|uniref:NACHT domain-containing protein n=1 Tax=Pseudoalteromonas sp. SWXJZ94C TaxID=2792065 RepID=UPI0018CCEE13|nr:hypothetical protein [Pseudoalteromonas sp. SWXJZ94C]MBH0057981.1 hypothetical protein [Pseudoalteromonas sp. SWXJZ94C]